MNVDPVAVATGVGVVATAIVAVATVGRGVARRGRRLADFLDDWNGEDARPGVKARPGVMSRLEAIEGELRPNGGGSMRDAVNRLEAGQEATNARLANVEQRLAALESSKPVTVNVNQPQPPPSGQGV